MLRVAGFFFLLVAFVAAAAPVEDELSFLDLDSETFTDSSRIEAGNLVGKIVPSSSLSSVAPAAAATVATSSSSSSSKKRVVAEDDDESLFPSFDIDSSTPSGDEHVITDSDVKELENSLRVVDIDEEEEENEDENGEENEDEESEEESFPEASVADVEDLNMGDDEEADFAF